MAEVTLDGVRKLFGSVTAVEDFTLSIGNGEFVVFVGPSRRPNKNDELTIADGQGEILHRCHRSEQLAHPVKRDLCHLSTLPSDQFRYPSCALFISRLINSAHDG